MFGIFVGADEGMFLGQKDGDEVVKPEQQQKV